MYRAVVLLRSVTILVSFAVPDASGRQHIEFTKAFGCDFDTSLCGFVQDSNDDFNWMRNMGGTSTGGTGPSADHTTGNGYYMYIETSSPRRQGDNAKLTGPLLKFSGNMCLKFYYHMYGVHIGTLNVSINGSNVFSASGDKGNKWLIATIDVNLSGKYAVTFEGIRGSDSLGDIAVDDVLLEIGSCYSTFGCNFDTSMCGFIQDSNNNLNWTRNYGDTPSNGTGPSADHTTGNGYYLYTETSSPRQQGDNVKLTSPSLQFIGRMCLKFYYHMYGANMGTLKLNLNGKYRRNTILFTASGNKGNKWRIATIDVNLLGRYKVTFEGRRRSYYQGDIAIDDFVLEPGSCSSENRYWSACSPRKMFILSSRFLRSLTKGEGDFSFVQRLNSSRRLFYQCDSDWNGLLEMREVVWCFQLWSYEGLVRLWSRNPGCLYKFIKSCDDDGNPGLSRQEWFTCFNIEEGQWRWSPWSDCSVTCGDGQQRRTASTCISPSTGKILVSQLCAGDHNETRHCTNGECPGQWRWSPWSDCSVTCGDGQQRRTGTCISPSTGKILVSQLCAGENNETRHCNNGECPGQWRWSPWSDCSVTCGDGQQRRTGTCISPSTGKILVSQLCAGENNETRHCTNGECPGQWRWSPWSDCSVTCGDGQQNRTGTCISPSTGKILANQLCPGDHNETRHCTNGECPDWISSATTEGKWSRWSPWADCSRTCGKGGQSRNRICKNKVTGKSLENGWCAGKPLQKRTCADWKCPDGRKSRCPSNKEGTLKGRVLSLRDAPLAGANISLAESPYLILSRSQDNGFFVVDLFCFEKEKPLLITRNGYVPQIVEVANSRSVLKVKMENAVHPTVTSHPEDRRRFVGQDVIFCCQVEGNPPPVIEWFRNGNILDKEEYNNNETLVLRRVGKNMAGDFRCRAVNEFGAEFSEPATLTVLDPVVDTCNSTPSDHFVTLPDGCLEDGTNKKKVNIGKCNSHPCLRADTRYSESCDEAERCCQAGTESETTVRCGLGEFKMKRVVSCRCDVCRERNTIVKGIVLGGLDDRPVEYCDILVNGTLVAFSDFDGTFEIPVPKSAKRLVATFRDFMEKYEELIVVLPFRKGTTTFHKIHLRPEAPPIEFDAEEEKAVPIASDDTAEVIIPANSLIDKDGNPKKGKAKVKIQFNDPRKERDILESPGDFTTVDEDGEEQLLRTYGLFKIKIQDENNQNLGLTKNLHINIDLEQLTGEEFDESEPFPHLWWLDEKTGRWVDAGQLKRTQELTQRPKRRLRNRAFSGEITPENLGYFNVDRIQQRCLAKVRANAEGEGIDGAKITSIFINGENSARQVLQGYTHKHTNPDGYACIYTQCNSKGYLEVEKDGLPLLPDQVDRLPNETGASIVDGRRIKFNPGAQNDNGPVYPGSEMESCRLENAGQSFFSFLRPENRPEVFNQDYVALVNKQSFLLSSRVRRCFVKILTSGTTSTLVKAESLSEDGQTKLGETVKQTEEVDNSYAACLEYRCPLDTKMLIRFTVLTGECQRSKVQKRLGTENNGLAPNVERIVIPTRNDLSGSTFGIFEWSGAGSVTLEKFKQICVQKAIDETAGGELKGFAVKFSCAK